MSDKYFDQEGGGRRTGGRALRTWRGNARCLLASDFTSIYRGNNKSRCTGRSTVVVGSRPNTQSSRHVCVNWADSRALGDFRNLASGAHAAWWREVFHRRAYLRSDADRCDIAWLPRVSPHTHLGDAFSHISVRDLFRSALTPYSPRPEKLKRR